MILSFLIMFNQCACIIIALLKLLGNVSKVSNVAQGPSVYFAGESFRLPKRRYT